MDSTKDLSAATASRSRLRYPLRSASKLRDEKSASPDLSTASAWRRGRPPSSVSKSVSVLDFSGKDKPAKPPRRLSIPSKPAMSPRPATVGSITPISESRGKPDARGKSDTLVSDGSKSAARRKFSVLSSVSYWLTQIKLSESACKHSISLGFFKLAMESGCEPMQRMCEELKSYARRHNILAELGETARELLQSYNILEELEQLQVSETCSHVPEGSKSSDEEINGSSTSSRTGKLKPKCLNSEVLGVAETIKKESIQKNFPAARNRPSYNKTPASPKQIQKKSQKASKLDSVKEKGKVKIPLKNPTSDDVKYDPSLSAEELPQENKENIDNHQPVEETLLTDEALTN